LDEHQLVLRPKDRSKDHKSNNPLPQRRSSRIKDTAAINEYRAALKAHNEERKELIEIFKKDFKKMKQEWKATKSSEPQDQDLITNDHGIWKSVVRT
jgi:hypothetical protein